MWTSACHIIIIRVEAGFISAVKWWDTSPPYTCNYLLILKRSCYTPNGQATPVLDAVYAEWICA